MIGSGLIAGFVNTIAGGGSLLTLPALMLAGLPATEANATNRLAVLAQTSTATHGFHKTKHLDWRGTSRLLMPTLIGAGLGAWLATEIPEAVMKPLLLGLLVVSAFLIAIGSRPKTEEDPTREPPGVTTRWAAMGACGFYGGFLQAGLGFAVLAAISLLHRTDLVR
ncbi:MAG: sulfite exporter TauE/SafE family protein, partial [Myxococcota bacterium]|nr:sulfite exporter TauE/SafE family protein [Myxococcota bacterium]